MQEFLKLLTSWGKVCPFFRMYGATQLGSNIFVGLAANNETGDILSFLAHEERVTTHHVLQILKSYKQHRKPSSSNNVLEHVFEVKECASIKQGQTKPGCEWISSVATYSCCMAGYVWRGFLLYGELRPWQIRV